MKNFRSIDRIRRIHIRKKEFFLLLYKFLVLSINLPYIFKLHLKYKALFKKTGEIRNVCIFSGRTNGVYNYFGASRFVLKGMFSTSILPGLQKLS